VPASDGTPVLDVRELRIETAAGAPIVGGISFRLHRGEVLALVGESGCGKTSTALALLGHARRGTRIAGGSVLLDGLDLLRTDRRSLRKLRGAAISYVPQDPVSGLNPRRLVGDQVAEPLIVHGAGRGRTQRTVAELFAKVSLPNEPAFLRRYPFELSGGQQQRVAIAAALVAEPDVVVLDEPTTGLDVTTQAGILKLLAELARTTHAGFVYVTHDLAVVNHLADRVVVMYAGTDVETGPREALFSHPTHPYTTALLDSAPDLARARQLVGIAGTAPAPGQHPPGCSFAPRCPIAFERCRTEPPPPVEAGDDHLARCWRAGELARTEAALKLRGAAHEGTLLAVEGVEASYGTRDRRATVLHDISLAIAPGECLALVGESGSGKSTLGRCIAGLHSPDHGVISLNGKPLAALAGKRTAAQRREIQIVFQNPDRSLNPRETVGRAIWRPLWAFERLRRNAAQPRIIELLERVRLRPSMITSFPAELSGGERQRVAIARALAARPRLLICDEITSSLDVSIQAAIVSLLDELREGDLALLFITHNLALVRSVATKTLVLERGHVRDRGDTDEIIDSPQHPYTRALIAAAPDRVTGAA